MPPTLDESVKDRVTKGFDPFYDDSIHYVQRYFDAKPLLRRFNYDTTSMTTILVTGATWKVIPVTHAKTFLKGKSTPFTIRDIRNTKRLD